MHSLLTITWDMSRGIDLGFITLRYYSLLFAAGFVLGYLIMKSIFKKEGVGIDKLDTLLTYVVIATIVGARLGHVFFYEWDYYSEYPGEILKVWKGGLASHGAAVAIIIAIIIYCKRVLKKSTLWMLDRLVITIALAGALIRMGNFFNSEIYGSIGNSNLETVYLNPVRERLMDGFPFIQEVDFSATGKEEIGSEVNYPIYSMDISFVPDITHDEADLVMRTKMADYINNFKLENQNILFPQDFGIEWDMDQQNVAHVEVLGVPRYPTQIYEAVAYFLIFLILYRLYLMQSVASRQGFLFGVFLILVFGFRFFIEYYKEVQVSSEQGQALNIGQKLSIPLVLAGLFFVFRSKKIKE